MPFFCILSATIYALIGMGIGIMMGISQDHSMAPVHAHLNLLGWVSFAIYGLFYHAQPHIAESRRARLHIAMATLGVWLLIPGIAMASMGMSEVPAVLGSLLTVASMALFAAIVAGSRKAA